FVDAVAEGAAGEVEGDRHMSGTLGGDHVDEHPGEAVHRVGGLAAAVAETVGGQGEEGAEGHRVPVEEEDALVVGVTRTHEEKSPTSPPPSPPARLWQARPMNDPMPSAASSTARALGGAPTGPPVSAELRDHFAPLLRGTLLERCGIELLTLDAGGGTASMPVEGNT